MLKALFGHTSWDTAYIIPDYPCSFTLRCVKRVWLEYNPRKGFRLVSQTSNPRAEAKQNLPPGTVWNAEKKSTYTFLAIMGLDENDHVTWEGVSVFDVSKFEDFERAYGAQFDPAQRQVYDGWLAMRERLKHGVAK